MPNEKGKLPFSDKFGLFTVSHENLFLGSEWKSKILMCKEFHFAGSFSGHRQRRPRVQHHRHWRVPRVCVAHHVGVWRHPLCLADILLRQRHSKCVHEVYPTLCLRLTQVLWQLCRCQTGDVFLGGKVRVVLSSTLPLIRTGNRLYFATCGRALPWK